MSKKKRAKKIKPKNSFRLDWKKFILGAIIAILLIIFLIAIVTLPDPIVSLYFPPGADRKNSLGQVFEIDVKPASVSAKVPILMYHYIEYNRDPKDIIRASLTVNPYLFEKQLLELKTKNYETIALDELFSKKVANPVILTFDDGYRDFYTDAWPILLKYRMKATIYVVSDFLDRENYLTTDMLKQIATQSSGLITIGAHTRRHVSLPLLSKDVAWEEIYGSKTGLETLLKIPVKHFSYPYGSYNQEVLDLVSRAGLATATTTVPGTTHTGSEIFSLSRVRPGNYAGDKFLYHLR